MNTQNIVPLKPQLTPIVKSPRLPVLISREMDELIDERRFARDMQLMAEYHRKPWHSYMEGRYADRLSHIIRRRARHG